MKTRYVWVQNCGGCFFGSVWGFLFGFLVANFGAKSEKHSKYAKSKYGFFWGFKMKGICVILELKLAKLRKVFTMFFSFCVVFATFGS